MAAAPSAEHQGHAPVVTLGEAAQLLSVSTSTVRRWADQGRLRMVRTAGGHRRLLRADVVGAAGPSQSRPRLRPASVAPGPLPETAAVMQQGGAGLAVAAARSVYAEDARGWLGSAEAEPVLGSWCAQLADAVQGGDVSQAVDLTDALIARARQGGTGPAEIDAFLSQYLLRVAALVQDRRAGADQVIGTRRLCGRLRARVLDQTDWR